MSEKIYLPTDHLRPMWYRIAVANQNKGLYVSIHESAFQYLCGLPWDKRRDVPHFQSKYSLDDFVPLRPEHNFGFGGVMGFQCKFSGWFVWEVPLPILDHRDSEEIVRKREKTLRATLSILFEDLLLFDGDTGCNQQQLMLIQNMCVGQGGGGASISATLTPAILLWIKAQPDEESNREIVKAMKDAHSFMWPAARGHSGDFEVLFRNPDIVHFDIPGQSTGLDPEPNRMSGEGKGYTLISHNVGSPLHQLTLLIGLAKMHDLAAHRLAKLV